MTSRITDARVQQLDVHLWATIRIALLKKENSSSTRIQKNHGVSVNLTFFILKTLLYEKKAIDCNSAL